MSQHFDALLQSAQYQNSKKQLIQSIQQEISKIKEPKPANPEMKQKYDEILKSIETHRGRELFYKLCPSGAGNGPFVELADGSIKYDLITGIGVHFFGHGNLEIFESQLDGIWGEVMQGNLGPNADHLELMKLLLDAATGSSLKKVWLTTCGAIANEIALKIIRQKKFPASKIFAFKDCFAGRTTAMQEITDNPKYREGQPVYGEVSYLPFYDAHSKSSAAEQASAVIRIMKEECARFPGKFACIEVELVQGEGGFNVAPKEFIAPILEEAKKLNLAVWVDEIQTFGRTGEFFCFQKLGLEKLVDVVTVAKLLQAGAAMYSEEYNPKAGLISGTFSTSSSAIRSGIQAMKILKERIVGPKGRIHELEKLTLAEFERMKGTPAGKHIKDVTVYGGMIAFTLYDGSLEHLKKFLFKLWDLGVIGFYCGHGPHRARLLPPFGAVTNEQWKNVMTLIERAIIEAA